MVAARSWMFCLPAHVVIALADSICQKDELCLVQTSAQVKKPHFQPAVTPAVQGAGAVMKLEKGAETVGPDARIMETGCFPGQISLDEFTLQMEQEAVEAADQSAVDQSAVDAADPMDNNPDTGYYPDMGYDMGYPDNSYPDSDYPDTGYDYPIPTEDITMFWDTLSTDECFDVTMAGQMDCDRFTHQSDLTVVEDNSNMLSVEDAAMGVVDVNAGIRKMKDDVAIGVDMLAVCTEEKHMLEAQAPIALAEMKAGEQRADDQLKAATLKQINLGFLQAVKAEYLARAARSKAGEKN